MKRVSTVFVVVSVIVWTSSACSQRPAAYAALAALNLAPGVHHCGLGEGAWQVDFLSVLEEWVERCNAPEHITASRPLENGGARTRPLCPHPQIASYTGQGSSDDARSFVCTAPSRQP